MESEANWHDNYSEPRPLLHRGVAQGSGTGVRHMGGHKGVAQGCGTGVWHMGEAQGWGDQPPMHSKIILRY